VILIFGLFDVSNLHKTILFERGLSDTSHLSAYSSKDNIGTDFEKKNYNDDSNDRKLE